MIIDYSNDAVTVNIQSKLKAAHLSQLHFFGFVKSEDRQYVLSASNVDSSTQKFINYLNKEKIPYSSSPSFQVYTANLQQAFNDFESIKIKCRNFKNGKYDKNEIKEFNRFVETNIPRKLRDHQLKAAYHLYLAGNGANFSVPGSGKTTVVLSVYEKLRVEGKANILFVAGPPSCFCPWKTEFYQTFNRDPKFKILSGGDRGIRKEEYYDLKKDKELYLITYQTLLNDQAEIIKFFDQQGRKVFFVIDEAHYMKQIGGNWARAILRIANHAQYRCVLTGTPLPKSYVDVFNLFDVLWPKHNPIDSRTKNLIRLKEKNDSSVKEILESSIGPLFYRVRKSDIGLLTPVFHPPVLLKMNNHERLIYDAIENKIRDYAKKDYLANISLIMQLRRGRMIRLRQCVSYSKLLFGAIKDYKENIIDKEPSLKRLIIDYDKIEKPAKLEYLINFVTKMQQKKQKLIIWANFTGTIDLIRTDLKKAGFYCKTIYGKTPFDKGYSNEGKKGEVLEEDTREKIRNEFVAENSGLDILIANPAACAESISLHKTCFHALYYDLSYNCAQYIQSLDRIHRVGGSEQKRANYYFLQYKDTIDQDIKSNLDDKNARMSGIVDSDYSIYSLNMFDDEGDIQAYERIFAKKNG